MFVLQCSIETLFTRARKHHNCAVMQILSVISIPRLTKISRFLTKLF